MKTRWSWLEGAPAAQDAALGGLAGAAWLGPAWPTKRAALEALAEDALPGVHTIVRISDVLALAPFRLRAIQLPLIRIPRTCEACGDPWSSPVTGRSDICPRCRMTARSAHFRSTHTPGAA